MNDTDVDSEFGEEKKAFSSSSDHHGGFRVTAKKHSKHTTTVIAISASGRTAPTLFIVAGKLIMSNWFFAP